MTRLIWNESGSRYYEYGVDRGVFYPPERNGVPWNGLISMREAPSGLGKSMRHFDGEKYYTETTGDSFSGTIEAFTYPEAFEPYDGTDSRHLSHQATRRPFNLSYRTLSRNDLDVETVTIHLVYNVLVSPSAKGYASLAEGTEPTTFSWDFTTIPVHVPGAKPTAHLSLVARRYNQDAFQRLEDYLYGKEGTEARFPTPQQVIALTNHV